MSQRKYYRESGDGEHGNCARFRVWLQELYPDGNGPTEEQWEEIMLEDYGFPYHLTPDELFATNQSETSLSDEPAAGNSQTNVEVTTYTDNLLNPEDDGYMDPLDPQNLDDGQSVEDAD